MKPQAAVLTGDLIGSTEAPPEAVEAAMVLLSYTAQRIDLDTHFTRYRGDGWQVFLGNPGLGLASMLLLATVLRAAGGLESRIALGLGDAHIENKPGTATGTATGTVFVAPTLASASGSAFVASGRALDDMRTPTRLALAGVGVDKLHVRLIAMIDKQTSAWSKEQAEVIEMLLSPQGAPTQSLMAQRLGISRQAVAARIHSADFHQINWAANDFLAHFGPGDTPDA